jgi:hypothetical protein
MQVDGVVSVSGTVKDEAEFEKVKAAAIAMAQSLNENGKPLVTLDARELGAAARGIVRDWGALVGPALEPNVDAAARERNAAVSLRLAAVVATACVALTTDMMMVADAMRLEGNTLLEIATSAAKYASSTTTTLHEPAESIRNGVDYRQGADYVAPPDDFAEDHPVREAERAAATQAGGEA